MSQVFAPGIRSLQRRSDNTPFGKLEAELMPALVALRNAYARCTFVGRKGDLVLSIVDIDEGPWKKTPALLLVNRADPNRQFRWPLNRLWLLLEHEHNRAAFARAAELLFAFPTRQDENRVLDALFDFAEDLKNAKPPQGYSVQEWLQALAEDDMHVTAHHQVLND